MSDIAICISYEVDFDFIILQHTTLSSIKDRSIIDFNKSIQSFFSTKPDEKAVSSLLSGITDALCLSSVDFDFFSQAFDCLTGSVQKSEHFHRYLFPLQYCQSAIAYGKNNYRMAASVFHEQSLFEGFSLDPDDKLRGLLQLIDCHICQGLVGQCSRYIDGCSAPMRYCEEKTLLLRYMYLLARILEVNEDWQDASEKYLECASIYDVLSNSSSVSQVISNRPYYKLIMNQVRASIPSKEICLQKSMLCCVMAPDSPRKVRLLDNLFGFPLFQSITTLSYNSELDAPASVFPKSLMVTINDMKFRRFLGDSVEELLKDFSEFKFSRESPYSLSSGNHIVLMHNLRVAATVYDVIRIESLARKCRVPDSIVEEALIDNFSTLPRTPIVNSVTGIVSFIDALPSSSLTVEDDQKISSSVIQISQIPYFNSNIQSICNVINNVVRSLEESSTQ